jgi:paraquat-inducible protein B
VGAPVLFRGVKIGTVSDIRISVDEEGSVSIPVYVALDLRRVSRTGGVHTRHQAHAYMRKMVKEGLRAELELQSFVTGQLTVQFDFFPNEPVRLTRSDGEVPELPTRASTLQRLSRSVDQMPLGDIAQKTANAIDELVTLVQSPEFRQGTKDLTVTMHDLRDLVRQAKETAGPAIDDLQTAVNSLRTLVDNINEQIEPLTQSVSGAAAETSRLMQTARTQVDTVGPRLGAAADAARQTFTDANRILDADAGPASDLLRNWNAAAESAAKVMDQARQTLESVEQIAGVGSPTQTIRELNRTAQALRGVAEYLRRHPEALIHGRGKPQRSE